MKLLILFFAFSAWAEDPSLSKDDVREAGESLHPTESLEPKQFLEIVRACRGKGMGSCLRAQKDRVASFNRRELVQIKDLLRKCI